MIELALAAIGALTVFVAAVLFGWSLWIKFDCWRKGTRCGPVAPGW